jgi:hypothetical protein
MFTEQHRAVPDIAKLYNASTYQGILESAAVTNPDQRPICQAAIAANEVTFNKKTPLIFLDNSFGVTEIYSVDSSKYNKQNCKVIVNLVAD